jgi:DNA polymerase III subunit epsilon
MASVCQIGLVRLVGGAVSDEWMTYVDPNDFFDELNVSLHGIDERTVAGAPTFGEVAARVNAYLDGQVVVTHTHFDRVAVYQAASRCGSVLPNCTWLDSARVARRAWSDLAHSGYGLANVCERIGHAFKHHDALEDAKAAAQIMLSAMSESGLDIDGWLKRVCQPLDVSTANERSAREGNPEGELYGEVLVFTGALHILRREAADLAAAVGCEVDTSVTRKTTLLVVGDQDVRHLAGHTRSSKHRKAEELIRHGQQIRILRESDFKELVKLSS